jgi:hypothetical protein
MLRHLHAELIREAGTDEAKHEGVATPTARFCGAVYVVVVNVSWTVVLLCMLVLVVRLMVVEVLVEYVVE